MSKKVFKILSIDGGGIKGLYSSTILEHLEKKYQAPISDYFDMLCGTSTGGLISLALSLKIPATEISKIYSEKGILIFPKRNKFWGKIRQTLWKGKYSDKPLKKILAELFGERTLAESNNLLCIPSYSYTDAKPRVFKYDHTEGEMVKDNGAFYRDIALATSAAPTFFPLAEIDYYDRKQFIDGGVWANNPALVGIIEALTYFVGEGKEKEYDSIQLLSISSLNNHAGKPIGAKREMAFVHWREDLFNTSLIGQNHFTEYFLEKLVPISTVPITYVRIPPEDIGPEQQHLIQLDRACGNAITLIRGKGNDRGVLASKDPAIEIFFKTKKTYKN